MSYPHLATDCHEYHDLVIDYGAGPRPEIVLLCGSTRFHQTFRTENLRLTLAGAIVLSIGCDTKSDGDLTAADQLGDHPDTLKARLDTLHLRKIDLADRVHVLDVDGYLGESTRREIAYATKLGKPISYLSEVSL